MRKKAVILRMLWMKSKAEVSASAEGLSYRSGNGKKTKDAEQYGQVNRSAAGELGKVGMGQVMYGLLGCEEYGLSLMQWEATGELPNLILALSRSSCSLYEEWALRKKEWKQRDHLGDLEKIRQR